MMMMILMMMINSIVFEFDDDDEDWLYLICTPCLGDSLTFEGDRSVV